MTQNATLLLQAADVLEKTAEYIENAEGQRLDVERQEKTKTAQDLATKISATVGDEVSAELIEKLSSLSPDVQDLVERMAVGGEVDSLGGVPREEKVASDRAGMNSADARFLDWLNS